MTEFLFGVTGVVEANSFEQHMLWSENRHRRQPKTWEQINPGLLETIGTLDGRMVCISLSKVRVDGHLILFWHATSQVVDHVMIEKWIEGALPLSAFRETGRPNRTDAMNFHNVCPCR